jgi:hypothetical protein
MVVEIQSSECYAMMRLIARSFAARLKQTDAIAKSILRTADATAGSSLMAKPAEMSIT